jgi:hypothetical protein
MHIIVLFSAIFVFIGCAGSKPEAQSGEIMTIEQVKKIQAAHEDEWMSLPGVEGVGIGECDGVPCIKIFVSEKTDAVNAIGSVVDGVTIVIEVSGEYKALDSD